MKDFTAKFYAIRELSDSRNIVIENIESYLSSRLRFTFSQVQFQKVELFMTIKIPQNQIQTLPIRDDEYWGEFRECNYLSLKLNQESEEEQERILYYFILRKRWKGTQTIELDLKMDVLNTFNTDNPYDLGDKVNKRSSIKRLHKDRFTLVNHVPYPEYDYFPENINPTLFKASSTTLKDSRIDTDWYLIYESDTTTGVKCHLCPSEDLTIRIQNAEDDVVLNAIDVDNTIDNGECLLFYARNPSGAPSGFTPPLPAKSFAGSFQVRIDGVSYTIDSSYTAVGGGYQLKYKVLMLVQGTSLLFQWAIAEWTMIWDGTSWTTLQLQYLYDGMGDSVEFVNHDEVHCAYCPLDDANPQAVNNNFITWAQVDFDVQGTIEVSFYGIDHIDRTNSKLYKIIKLPYCPASYEEIDVNIYQFEDRWTFDYDEHMLKLTDMNAEAFIGEIPLTIDNPLYAFANKSYINSDLREDANETKLWSSEFFSPKIVYDSFTFQFQLERMRHPRINQVVIPQYFTFKFVMTSTINSKFLFDFKKIYEGTGRITGLLLSTEDYDSIMAVARNNEMPIYNNEYLNYLRTAYRYDLKAIDRTKTSTIVGATLGVAGSMASAGLGIASGNPAVAVSSILSSSSNIATTIMNSINSVKSAEDEFAKKQEQLQAQSFSVSGSDDIDLLTYYSTNRAKYIVYQMSNRMRQVVADLFYYCGYATNENGNPFQNGVLTTRKYFNYIQCDLIFNELCYNEDITADIVAKYSQGVTIFHDARETGATTGVWDLAQVKENKEVIL